MEIENHRSFQTLLSGHFVPFVVSDELQIADIERQCTLERVYTFPRKNISPTQTFRHISQKANVETEHHNFSKVYPILLQKGGP
jgi:hypothetical protein